MAVLGGPSDSLSSCDSVQGCLQDRIALHVSPPFSKAKKWSWPADPKQLETESSQTLADFRVCTLAVQQSLLPHNKQPATHNPSKQRRQRLEKEPAALRRSTRTRCHQHRCGAPHTGLGKAALISKSLISCSRFVPSPLAVQALHSSTSSSTSLHHHRHDTRNTVAQAALSRGTLHPARGARSPTPTGGAHLPLLTQSLKPPFMTLTLLWPASTSCHAAMSDLRTGSSSSTTAAGRQAPNRRASALPTAACKQSAPPRQSPHGTSFAAHKAAATRPAPPPHLAARHAPIDTACASALHTPPARLSPRSRLLCVPRLLMSEASSVPPMAHTSTAPSLGSSSADASAVKLGFTCKPRARRHMLWRGQLNQLRAPPEQRSPRACGRQRVAWREGAHTPRCR